MVLAHGDIEHAVGKYVHLSFEGQDYRVYFEEAGGGVPLVCLHSAGADSREWRHILEDEDITSKFRVIAFDLPRHGKSNPPPAYYKEQNHYRLNTKLYTGIIMAFIDALKLEMPVIIGSSMGGRVCYPLEKNYGEKLRAFIVVASSWALASGRSVGLEWVYHPHVHGGEACATFTYGLMAPQSPEDYRREVWWVYSQGGPGVYQGDLYWGATEADFRNLATGLDGKKFFFLTGEYDFSAKPETTKQTANMIKGAECVIMKNLGHFPMSENPSAFKEYLMPVLQKILSRS